MSKRQNQYGKFVAHPGNIVFDDDEDDVQKGNPNHDMHGRFTSGAGSYHNMRANAENATQAAMVHQTAEAHHRAADAHRRAGEMVHGADADYHRQYRTAHLKHAKALEQGVHPGRFLVHKDAPDVGDVHVPNAGGKDPSAKRKKPKAVMYMQGGMETKMGKAMLFNELLKAADSLTDKPAGKKQGKHEELEDQDTGLDYDDDLTSDELDDEDDDDDTMDSYGDKAVHKSYAYTPKDGEPKLDISDAHHVAMACAALSSGGFRGNRVQLPKEAVEGVKAKVRAAWRKFNPDKSDDEMPDGIRKGVSEVEIPLEFAIMKLDEEHRVVYGFASVSKYNGAEVTDLQNDVVDMNEITKAAHDFIVNSRSGNVMHNGETHGTIVESLIVDQVTKHALGITRPEEGWFIGYKANDDETWSDIKAGKFTGFSIGGTGVRTPV